MQRLLALLVRGPFAGLCVLDLFQEPDEFLEVPDVIGDARSDGRRRLERRVDATEVVVGEVERYGAGEVFELLAVGVRETGEAAHRHSHREVLTLDVARRDRVGIGVADPHANVDAGADGRAVALASFLVVAPVLFDHLRKVHVEPEGLFDGLEVRVVPIRGQLDALGQPLREIADEPARVLDLPLADVIRGHQLGVGVERRPRPDVAVTQLPHLVRPDVLLLDEAERPDLVALDPLGLEPAHGAVVVRAAGVSEIDQELRDGVLARAGHAAGGADGIALDERADDGSTFLNGQPIHTDYYA
jgi:hypothetical protein